MKRSTRHRLNKKKQIWRQIIATKIFHDYLENSKFDLDSICHNIEKYWGVIHKYAKVLQDEEEDYRHGYLTYGYESLKEIQYSLKYISDRFGCAFRLAWMLNVPTEVFKLQRIEEKQ